MDLSPPKIKSNKKKSLHSLRNQLVSCYNIRKSNEDMINNLWSRIEFKIRYIFDRIDTNNSGQISQWEFLKHYLRNEEKYLSDSEVNNKAKKYFNLMSNIDTNKDNLISYDECIEFQWKLMNLGESAF